MASELTELEYAAITSVARQFYPNVKPESLTTGVISIERNTNRAGYFVSLRYDKGVAEGGVRQFNVEFSTRDFVDESEEDCTYGLLLFECGGRITDIELYTLRCAARVDFEQYAILDVQER